AGDLATLLARGEIDLALGGLVDYGLEEVRCVPARHLIGAPAGSSRGRVLRQVFFPNTWWLCRDDRLWCWRVRAFLWAHRRHVRFGYRECSLQIGKTCILGALIPAPGRQRRACC
ncbi:MAG TPA: hypothetical protein VK325_00610, partial [Pseudoxanthomonas sp.]|nr:hypothetical protein [Pseudoxanthomonas sp.]